MTTAKKLLFWSVLLAVTVLSLIPVPLVPQAFNFWDKAQHALAFLGLTVLACWAYPQLRWSSLLLALLGFGAAIEVAQGFTGWRYAEVADWLADLVGVVLALSLRQVWLGFRQRVRE